MSKQVRVIDRIVALRATFSCQFTYEIFGSTSSTDICRDVIGDVTRSTPRPLSAGGRSVKRVSLNTINKLSNNTHTLLVCCLLEW